MSAKDGIYFPCRRWLLFPWLFQHVSPTACASIIKCIVEQHSDGFVAYPLGRKGVVVGQGDTRDAALADAQSAARFHRDTFGIEVVEDGSDLIDAEMVEAGIDDERPIHNSIRGHQLKSATIRV